MYYDLPGSTLLGVCFTQGSRTLLIPSLTASAFGILRFVIYKLTGPSLKGEMPMRKKVFNNAKLLTAATLESIWAMLVSYAVGTSLSPIVHKL